MFKAVEMIFRQSRIVEILARCKPKMAKSTLPPACDTTLERGG
jgi:hypothetical protein